MDEVSIFIRPIKRDQTLKDFASDFFNWLNVTSFELKTASANQDVWTFYAGHAIGIEVSICENEIWRQKNRKELEKYRFIVSFAPEDTAQAADYLEQHAHLLAWRFSHKGFRCFVPKDFMTASNDGDGMVYDF